VQSEELLWPNFLKVVNVSSVLAPDSRNCRRRLQGLVSVSNSNACGTACRSVNDEAVGDRLCVCVPLVLFGFVMP